MSGPVRSFPTLSHTQNPTLQQIHAQQSSAKSYLENNLAQGWNTAVSLLLIAISVAAGLLLSQGLAVGATSLYGWCSAKATTRGRRRWRQRQQRAESRGVVIQGGMDSVYF